MMATIKCPACQTEGSFSLLDSTYQGPYRCWKCHTLFTIEIHDGELIICEPLTEEECAKQQRLQAIQDKLTRQFPGRQESD